MRTTMDARRAFYGRAHTSERLETFWQKFRELRYGTQDFSAYLRSIVLSRAGRVRDARGKKLRMGNTVRVLCEEEDGVGPPSKLYGDLDPHQSGNELPRVHRLVRENGRYYALLKSASPHEQEVAVEYLERQ
ncbi:MAG: hypothetical protein HY470_00500 [Candidatus Ryanbacteria bacterium]|nr:hypothetical protein [Candidatus Ryanbacteria bacterium]